MKVTIEELLLIRDSLLDRIRKNTRIIDANLDLIGEDTEKFKEETEPFVKEMEDCTSLISKVQNELIKNGSVL